MWNIFTKPLSCPETFKRKKNWLQTLLLKLIVILLALCFHVYFLIESISNFHIGVEKLCSWKVTSLYNIRTNITGMCITLVLNSFSRRGIFFSNDIFRFYRGHWRYIVRFGKKVSPVYKRVLMHNEAMLKNEPSN